MDGSTGKIAKIDISSGLLLYRSEASGEGGVFKPPKSSIDSQI
jgi:hypothetical protein